MGTALNILACHKWKRWKYFMLVCATMFNHYLRHQSEQICMLQCRNIVSIDL